MLMLNGKRFDHYIIHWNIHLFCGKQSIQACILCSTSCSTINYQAVIIEIFQYLNR